MLLVEEVCGIEAAVSDSAIDCRKFVRFEVKLQELNGNPMEVKQRTF
jgi:hypothetical protein